MGNYIEEPDSENIMDTAALIIYRHSFYQLNV